MLAARAGPGRPGWDPFSSPLFRLQVTGVGDRPLPLELLGGVQLGQQQLVQPLPDARLLPRPQPPPRGHPAAEAELLRQVLPADPRVQHKQDPLQRAAGHQAACDPDSGSAAASRGNNGSIRSHNPSGTSHGFARIDIPPELDDGCRRIRYRRTGPFIQLEVLSHRARGFRHRYLNPTHDLPVAHPEDRRPAFWPAASQRRCFPFASTKTAVAYSPFTVIETMRPAHGRSRCHRATSARVSSLRTLSRPGRTRRAGRRGVRPPRCRRR